MQETKNIVTSNQDFLPDRRRFLKNTAIGSIGLMLGSTFPFIVQKAQAKIIEVPKLPYEEGALAPVISANTVGFHYRKHHLGYADKLNELIKDQSFADMDLVAIIRATVGKPEHTKIFNAAAQVWNHSFYWRSLDPKGGGRPRGIVSDLINSSFGDFDKFKQELTDAAVSQFGSGWAWLVDQGGSLAIIKTSNADTALTHGHRPLLTIDVWEHAYYLDYQNRRVDYVNAIIDKLLNWSFVEENLNYGLK